MLSSLRSTLVSRIFSPSVSSAQFASGRWYPQPARALSTDSNSPSSTDSPAVATHPETALGLNRAYAAPLYARPRGETRLGTVRGRRGELLADYVTFEEAMKRTRVPWTTYEGLTSEERDVVMAHAKSIREKKMYYIDPKTNLKVMSINQLLVNGKCCGNGCRHCPYGMENASEETRRYEMSKHRSRPPNMGIHRRTRCVVVDNSQLGKEAHNSGKLAYCIHVYKQGYRAKHMPHATLGDKILVAIRGEMKKAFVVGANTHVHLRKHGVPVTDTNNIVLLNEEGNPLGTRVTAPIPAQLKDKVTNAQFAKVLAISNKYM